MLANICKYSCCQQFRIDRIMHAKYVLFQIFITKFEGECKYFIESITVHLTPNTIFAKMQTWSCSKSNLTFFHNIWIFFEQQYNLKFDMLCLMTELVRGMGLFLVWPQILICMHVRKELMPCKWVCVFKSRIEPGLCWLGREPIDNKFQLVSANF